MADPSAPAPEPDARAQQVRDLQVVNGFATRLLQIRASVDDILWDVATEVVAQLGLLDCVIYLVDRSGGPPGHLVQRAAYGPKNPAGREIKDPLVLEVGRGIVGSVAASGRAERIADTRVDPRYVADDAPRLSELAVPILAAGDGSVVGVIDSEHPDAGFFTAHHEALLTAIASMTASRLALAELHQRLRDWNRALEREVEARTAELRLAHARSERLLLNVLPAPIAARLERGETRIADRADDVAVLFADLVGFTPVAARLAPEEVVGLLERVFGAFDDAALTARCEKVKTVGDEWMAVCGLPEPAPDALPRLCALGLRLVEVLAELGDPALQVRIGVHQGPVVAGVIGRSKFAWDLWGDTVNLASRLESHGVAGAVHVTAEVAARLPPGFRVTPRGEVLLKGLGRVPTALLTGAPPA